MIRKPALLVDVDFFVHRRKIIRFRKYQDTCERGLSRIDTTKLENTMSKGSGKI